MLDYSYLGLRAVFELTNFYRIFASDNSVAWNQYALYQTSFRGLSKTQRRSRRGVTAPISTALQIPKSRMLRATSRSRRRAQLQLRACVLRESFCGSISHLTEHSPLSMEIVFEALENADTPSPKVKGNNMVVLVDGQGLHQATA